MKFMLDIPVSLPTRQISYRDKVFAIGSCFTEHIGGRLQQLKFDVLSNPHGILFDPLSVCHSLESYLLPTTYAQEELILLHELWQSWRHHSMFSGTDPEAVITGINASQHRAHAFLKTTNWLIITLGSSFSYQLADGGSPVANCHRAPRQLFNKHLCSISETVAALGNVLQRLRVFNPELQVIFTISPVRHIRDGVVENNRSKARLIESVHEVAGRFDNVYYFPAYEWVIDVLRDYRYYDIDLVHPNFAATQFVFEQFVAQFISQESEAIMKEVQQFMTAYNHKPMHADTAAHQRFRSTQLEKLTRFMEKYDYIDLTRERDFFKEAK